MDRATHGPNATTRRPRAWTLAALALAAACGGGEEPSSPPAESSAGETEVASAAVAPTPAWLEPSAIQPSGPIETAPPASEPPPGTPPSVPATEPQPSPTPKADDDGLPDIFGELSLDFGESDGTETSFDVASSDAVETETRPRDIGAVLDQLNKERFVVITPTPTPIVLAHSQVLRTDPVREGDSSVDLIKAQSEGPAGPMASAEPGDYILRNSKAALVFAKIYPLRPGETVYVTPKHRYRRRQGSLLDILPGKSNVDFLGEMTQAYGTISDAPIFEYDSVEFATRPGAAGIRFTGSTVVDERETRIRTTYWLPSGESKVEIETQVIVGDPQAPIADHCNWGPALVFADADGPNTKKERELNVAWYGGTTGEMAMGFHADGASVSGKFAKHLTRVIAGKHEGGVWRRTLYLGEGQMSSVTDRIFEDSGRPWGELTGKILVKETNEPAPDGWADIFWYYRPDPSGPPEDLARVTFEPFLFTRVAADENGAFRAVLPADWRGNQGRYFVGSGGRSRGGGRSSQGIVVAEQRRTERDVYVSEPAFLSVKVVDGKTSQPIAARVRFDPIGTTPGSEFLSVDSPRGFLNFFYTGPDGAMIEINQGNYTLTASAGTKYDVSKVDVTTGWGQLTEAEIVMNEVAPTKGHVGLDVGAMTNATPGCTITAEDRVLMAAGEGLQWIVSGDLETLTDFAPAIEKAGFAGKIGSSMGFRTYSRVRPDWGEFLIYPVSAGMPDPAQTRSEWADAPTAKEFVAALRKNYPGALIESITPFTDNSGLVPGRWGYFHEEGWNVYQMAYEDDKRTSDVEMEIDAVNLFTTPNVMNYQWEKDFYAINTMRERFYVPAPVSNGRTALGGEPGWPRILVRTENENVAEIPEADLFKRMKEGRWQVTSGPFIDFEANGRKSGDIYKPETDARAKLKVNAPLWAHTTHIDQTKDMIMNWRDTNLEQAPSSTDRYDWEGDVALYPDLKGFADTLLSAQAWSLMPIEEILPNRFSPMPSFAINGPVIADTNGDGKYNPPELYRDKGK